MLAAASLLGDLWMRDEKDEDNTVDKIIHVSCEQLMRASLHYFLHHIGGVYMQ
jgi:hypothetical protein